MAQSRWFTCVTIYRKFNFQHPENPISKIKKNFNYKKISVLIIF